MRPNAERAITAAGGRSSDAPSEHRSRVQSLSGDKMEWWQEFVTS